MKRSSDTHERTVANRQREDLRNQGVHESEIDQILADSFPASDAPPWTLGVTPAQPESVEKPKRQRR